MPHAGAYRSGWVFFLLSPKGRSSRADSAKQKPPTLKKKAFKSARIPRRSSPETGRSCSEDLWFWKVIRKWMRVSNSKAGLNWRIEAVIFPPAQWKLQPEKSKTDERKTRVCEERLLLITPGRKGAGHGLWCWKVGPRRKNVWRQLKQFKILSWLLLQERSEWDTIKISLR